MTTTTEFQLVDINKLVPYANNARTHNKEQILKLRSSLREFGFVNPVIIDKDYNVLAGHGRIMAAKEEGISEVPCVYADHFTEAQKKAYILADNRMAMDAGWDCLYEIFHRVSCWCCPLQSLSELRKLYNHFPELWEQLKKWDGMTWRNFRADY